MTSDPSTRALPADWIPDGFDQRTVTVDGVRYFVVVGGSGPTIVLLHGWPQTGRTRR